MNFKSKCETVFFCMDVSEKAAEWFKNKQSLRITTLPRGSAVRFTGHRREFISLFTSCL